MAETLRWGNWDYRDGVITIAYVQIPICSERKPVVGKYLISKRLDGWQLSPATYDSSGHANAVADMPFYMLTYAPVWVNEELETL